MSINTEEIAAILNIALQPVYLDVQDEAYLHVGHANAGLGHFHINIVAACFIGKSRLTRHRMVYNALKNLTRFSLHALSIQTATPEEHVQFNL